ncbi:MAG: helix-turn-helix transcriptional regulator, partial [Lachnospiraceae bacterium]|nr:helix-turn-helix transcriptional regulator [Lachnospiraceae bacterium]
RGKCHSVRHFIFEYQLINYYGFSPNTISRLQHNEGMNTTTLNKLCLILHCDISDIITFEETEEEQEAIASDKKRMEELRSIHFSL